MITEPHLTATGRALIEKLYPLHAERAEKLFAPLTRVELNQIGRTMK